MLSSGLRHAKGAKSARRKAERSSRSQGYMARSGSTLSVRSTRLNGTDEREKHCVGIGAIVVLTSPLRSVALLGASIPDTHLSII